VSCDFTNSLLHSYFDGELDCVRAAEFEGHLQRCTECATELMDQDLLSGRLQLAHLYASAPASLWRKIRSDLSPVAPTTAVSKPLLWHWLAAVAALLLLPIVRSRVSHNLRSDDYQSELAGEIVEAHVSSLQPGKITGIASNDADAVRSWFDGRARFAVPVRDFANDGYALQGGRLDVVDGRSVAALVYLRNEHLINVFIWPTRERETPSRAGSQQGFQWVDWRRAKVEFCVVSDLDASDLEHLHQLINSYALASL